MKAIRSIRPQDTEETNIFLYLKDKAVHNETMWWIILLLESFPGRKDEVMLWIYSDIKLTLERVVRRLHGS